MQGNSITYIQFTPEQLQQFIDDTLKQARSRDIAIGIAISEAIKGCFNVDECAKHLKLSKATVLRRIHSRDIKVIDIDSVPYSIPKIQFSKSIIEQFDIEIDKINIKPKI